MSKKPKHKGRPPKFVLDENGKEVYGLSYNAAAGRFYAAFSSPRVYFGGGKINHELKKLTAIQRFKEYQKHQHLSPEQQAEAIYIDELHKKVREIIANDSFMQQDLNEKARMLLNQGELSKLVEEKVQREVEQKMRNHELDEHFQAYLDKYPRSPIVEQQIVSLLPRYIMDKKNSKTLCEQFARAIKYWPVEAAKLLGIKELVYIEDSSFKAEMKWYLAWKVFWVFHIPEHLPFPKEQFIVVEKKLDVHLHKEGIERISLSDFRYALNYHIQTMPIEEYITITGVEGRRYREGKQKEAQELMTGFLSIPLANRLKIVEHVFKTLRYAGFSQCQYVHGLIASL